MKKRIAKLLTLIMVALLLSNGLYIPARAEELTVFDAADMAVFSGRTKQSVANEYSNARYAGDTYVNGDRTTYYSVQASTQSPYAYGQLTDDTHIAMTAMTNYFRWLSGSKPLTANSTHSDKLQAEALDRNFEFNHWISNDSKPDDMPDDLWEEGYSCTHNILAWGYTPQGAITGWMNEGYSLRNETWGTLGHRTALVSPTLSSIQFGYVGSIAVGKDLTYKNTYNDAFAAFPAPGYMPNNLIYPSSSAWSVYLNSSKVKVTETNNVVVTVTNNNTNTSYSCTTDNDKLRCSSTEINFVQPSDADSSGVYTSSYSVEITGLKDASNNPAVIRYTVDFFDVNEYAPSYVKTASADKTKFIIYNSLDGTENLNKIAAILPREINITTETGKKYTIPASGEWKLDEANKCFYNSADASKLPNGVTDKNNVLSRAEIQYEISDDYYDSFNRLSISKKDVYEGEEVVFSVYRTNVSTDCSKIFKLSQNSDGTYSSEVKFDSETYTDLTKDGAYHKYTLKNITKDYTGDYISIYFNSSDYWEEAYVSRAIVSLNVKSIEENNNNNNDNSNNDNSNNNNNNNNGNNNNNSINNSNNNQNNQSLVHIQTSGIYCASTSPSIVAGLVVDNKSSITSDIEYQWLVCNEATEAWSVVSDWTVNNEWMNYTPSVSGNYIFVCKARIVGNPDSEESASFGTPFKKTGGIKQICQMPYWGEGGGYLIGFESYDNPNQEYQYEMFVMDLSLYAAGSPTPWVHATGKIKLAQGATPEDGKTMWTIWQPQYGYYLTLFRLYDKDGNMIDEVPYGFANAY